MQLHASRLNVVVFFSFLSSNLCVSVQFGIILRSLSVQVLSYGTPYTPHHKGIAAEYNDLD